MKKEIQRIIDYVDFITSEIKLFVSFHFAQQVYEMIDEGAIRELIPYIAHKNLYCRFVRSDPERQEKCILNQQQIRASLCGKDKLIHTCYAAAREIAYPIRLNDEVVGYATVSGYKGCSGSRMDSELWAVALSDEEIPSRTTDALIPPLCLMIEDLLAREKQNSTTEYNRILAYVSENHIHVTLDDVAKKFGRSRSHVSHVFKKRCGKSIRAYSNELKLMTAKKLLDTTDMSVTDIALEAGFCDTSYFIRLFGERYGITPHRYRAEK